MVEMWILCYVYFTKIKKEESLARLYKDLDFAQPSGPSQSLPPTKQPRSLGLSRWSLWKTMRPNAGSNSPELFITYFLLISLNFSCGIDKNHSLYSNHFMQLQNCQKKVHNIT